jgi:hypothetical protein
MRECVPGEIIINGKCFKCPKSHYSFSTSDSQCKSCKTEGLKCLGGGNTETLPGYWRSHN